MTFQAPDNKPWVSESDAEKILGISRRTLLKLRKAKRIPFFRPGRLVFYCIDDVLQALKQSADPQTPNTPG
jgi:excisionase family DNA binding protein